METRLLWKTVDSMAGASDSTHADHTEMMSVLSVRTVSYLVNTTPEHTVLTNIFLCHQHMRGGGKSFVQLVVLISLILPSNDLQNFLFLLKLF